MCHFQSSDWTNLLYLTYCWDSDHCVGLIHQMLCEFCWWSFCWLSVSYSELLLACCRFTSMSVSVPFRDEIKKLLKRHRGMSCVLEKSNLWGNVSSFVVVQYVLKSRDTKSNGRTSSCSGQGCELLLCRCVQQVVLVHKMDFSLWSNWVGNIHSWNYLACGLDWWVWRHCAYW